MENTKTLHALDEFAKTKPKEIPKELDEYLRYVAASGDPVYQWSLVKFLFRQKLLNALTEFRDREVPMCPNSDIFHFETVQKRLLDRYDMFTGVPFTIQRIAELLTTPLKQYGRVDKYMRALEKNVWVVSTREPATTRETSDQLNLVNGALSTVAHPEEDENNKDRLQEKTENCNDATADENCPKTNENQENNPEPAETPLADVVEAITETDPAESFASSESNSSDAPENVTIELATSDADTTTETEKSEEVSNEAQTTEPDSTVEDPAEEQKTEEITVSEVDEKEIIPDEAESNEPTAIVEQPADETEPEPEPVEEAEIEEKLRMGLKRKCEDEEEPSPSKKVDIELNETEDEPPLELETPIPAQVTEIIEELAQVKEIEVTMDSITEPEEKLAMVVEEPELAMEVDETSSQSPMVQEDLVEAMEESELAIS